MAKQLTIDDRAKASESLRALAECGQVPTWPMLSEAVMGTRQCMRRDVVGRLAELAAAMVTEEDHERQRKIIRDLQRERDDALKLSAEYRRVLNGVCKRLGPTDGRGLPAQDSAIFAELDCRLMSKDDTDWVGQFGGFDSLRDCFENDSRIVGAVKDLLWPDGAPCGLAGNNEIAAELDRRLMPHGMEWPRFDDGEKVRFDDEFECQERSTASKRKEKVVSFSFVQDGASLNMHSSFDARSERVKRPKPAPSPWASR